MRDRAKGHGVGEIRAFGSSAMGGAADPAHQTEKSDGDARALSIDLPFWL